METSILLALLDNEGKKLQAENPGTSALLYSAAEKIKALAAHQGEQRVSLDELADLKRGVDAGRGPGIQSGSIGIPALRL